MSAPTADAIGLSPWRLAAGVLVYPFLLIWLAVTFPITILAIFMNLRRL